MIFNLLNQSIGRVRYCSLSCEAEDVDDNVIIFKWIFLAEVSIVFRIPEATCRHMEPTVSFLQNDHICCEL